MTGIWYRCGYEREWREIPEDEGVQAEVEAFFAASGSLTDILLEFPDESYAFEHWHRRR
jgi:hypothetical protein